MTGTWNQGKLSLSHSVYPVPASFSVALSWSLLHVTGNMRKQTCRCLQQASSCLQSYRQISSDPHHKMLVNCQEIFIWTSWTGTRSMHVWNSKRVSNPLFWCLFLPWNLRKQLNMSINFSQSQSFQTICLRDTNLYSAFLEDTLWPLQREVYVKGGGVSVHTGVCIRFSTSSWGFIYSCHKSLTVCFCPQQPH